MNMSTLNALDPLQNMATYADSYFKWLAEPAIPMIDTINYFNALNLLNLGVFYKYINRETAKLFGVNQNNTYSQNNDFFTNSLFDIAMKYQQENIKENINNMFNISCPLKTFYDYNS